MLDMTLVREMGTGLKDTKVGHRSGTVYRMTKHSGELCLCQKSNSRRQHASWRRKRKLNPHLSTDRCFPLDALAFPPPTSPRRDGPHLKMATPSSTTDEKRPLEQITFRFCSECSNMLYPKEDADSRQLLYVCRTCQYTEEAATSCVFRNVMNSASGETAGVTQDVADDPTVSGDVCLLCGCFLMDVNTEEEEEGSSVAEAVALLGEWDEPDDWEPEHEESAPGAGDEEPAP